MYTSWRACLWWMSHQPRATWSNRHWIVRWRWKRRHRLLPLHRQRLPQNPITLRKAVSRRLRQRHHIRKDFCHRPTLTWKTATATHHFLTAVNCSKNSAVWHCCQKIYVLDVYLMELFRKLRWWKRIFLNLIFWQTKWC